MSSSPTTEREAREQLAACYRVFDYLGWTELIYSHITLRVPGVEGQFLINPYGLHFSEVTASNLVKIDIDGNRLDDSTGAINLAGFVQHSTFHRGLSKAHCVMHTHTTAGMAVASLEAGLINSNFYSALLGKVGMHDFEGVTTRPDEGPRLLASLDGRKALILRNHGLLTFGATVAEAFFRHWLLQRACEVQLASNGPVRLVDTAILQEHRDNARQMIPHGGLGDAEFAAMVRLVDRVDRSWRD